MNTISPTINTKLNRRIGVLILLIVFFASINAAQAKPIVLRMSHFMPPGHFWNKVIMIPWARELERRTRGRVKVVVYPGTSKYGSVAKQLQQVRDGEIDIARGMRGFPKGQLLATSVMELPFMVKDPGSGSLALWQLYKEGMLGKDFAEFKVLGLDVHEGAQIHTSVRPVVELDDLKGMRLRTPSQAVSAMLRFLGAEPKGIRPADIYKNLDSSTIDGVLTVWDLVHAAKLNDLLKYHTNAYAYTVAFYMVMNKEKYASLPAYVRKAIDDMSGDRFVAKFGKWWSDSAIGGRTQAQERGNTIIPVSHEKRERWRAQIKPMIDKYLADLEAKGVTNARQIYVRAQELVSHYERQLQLQPQQSSQGVMRKKKVARQAN